MREAIKEGMKGKLFQGFSRYIKSACFEQLRLLCVAALVVGIESLGHFESRCSRYLRVHRHA